MAAFSTGPLADPGANTLGTGSNAAKQPPNSPLLHPVVGHELKPSTIEPPIQGSYPSSPLLSLEHTRTALDSMLQLIFGPSAPQHLRWEVYSQGSPNALTWYAAIYIYDVDYGHGTAHTRGAAQDAAAMMALKHLQKIGSELRDLDSDIAEQPPDSPPDREPKPSVSNIAEQPPDSPPGRAPNPSVSGIAEQPSDSPPGRAPKPSVSERRIQRSYPSSSHSLHPRTALNNELQIKHGSSMGEHIRWEICRQGPPNASTWSAIVYVDDMNYGHGTARTRSGAQDAAAMNALEYLRRNRR
ncbi:hypothetical protein EDB19DRAFT_1044669 [Suillus lakei]|nr:hypothetical protein EDB19DRAFT_1044669 [Suillus lakei]